MAASQSPSPAVIAAAIAAILGSAVTFILGCFGLSALLQAPSSMDLPGVPPFMRSATLGAMVLLLGLCVFGIVTGVGLFRTRNWARLSAISWSWISIFAGAFGVLAAFLVVLPNTTDLVAGTMETLRIVVLLIYGVPILVGIWWLLLFTRPTIKSQFVNRNLAAKSALPLKPRCPVPLAVLAWFLITSAAHVVLLPFLPFRMPALLFGHLVRGHAGTLIFVLSCALFFCAGIGLLRLKRWSYPLTISLLLFWMASGLSNVLNSNNDSSVTAFLTEVQHSMHFPANPFTSVSYSQLARWSALAGVLFCAAILMMLLFYRKPFLEASASAAKL